jgi:LPXTG-motif cell wall-anchored protein
MKKIFAALTLAGSIALMGSTPAMAATYPPLPPAATVSDATVLPGEEFIFYAQGFLPGETVTITVTLVTSGAANTGGTAVSAKIPVFQAPQTLTATADAEGKIAVPMTLNEPGTYAITATGNTSGIVVGPVYVTVVAPLANTGTNAGGAPLANTGADASLLLWGAAGIGALGLGAGGVILARRNKSAASA